MGVGSTAIQTNGRATCPDCSGAGTLYNGSDGIMRCLSCQIAQREGREASAADPPKDPPKAPPQNQEQQPMGNVHNQKATDEQIREVVPNSATWAAAARALGITPKTLRDRGPALGVLPLNGGKRGKGRAASQEPTPPRKLTDEQVDRLSGNLPPLRDVNDIEIVEVRYLRATIDGIDLVVDDTGISVIDGNQEPMALPLLAPAVLRALATMVEQLEADR